MRASPNPATRRTTGHRALEHAAARRYLRCSSSLYHAPLPGLRHASSPSHPGNTGLHGLFGVPPREPARLVETDVPPSPAAADGGRMGSQRARPSEPRSEEEYVMFQPATRGELIARLHASPEERATRSAT